MIVGHKGAMSMTEKVYTHIDMQYLFKAINSIYYLKNIKYDKKFVIKTLNFKIYEQS